MREANVAIIAARKAGKVLLKYFRKNISFVRKGKQDIVTIADKQAEAIIIKEIKKHFPEHDILSEEAGEERNGSDYLWVIDPLDGTNNFFRGIPYWCTSIALLKNNEPIVGVIFDPFHNELFVAEKGKGATLNNKPINVSPTIKINDAMIVYEQGHLFSERSFSAVLSINKKVRALRIMGSSALDMANVAAGRFEAFFNRRVSLWDIAAGVVIVGEAGGKITTADNKRWDYSQPTLLATNSKLRL